MKKITLLITFLMVIVTESYGQGPVGSYAFSESTETYTAVSGTNSTATGDDGTQAAIPIGFTFNFDGTNYTTFGICTNGWVKLGSAAIGFGNWTNNLANVQAFNPLIAAFWDDNHRNTGSIQYVLSGVSPNQTLEIGFNDVNIGGGGSTSVNLASYKVRLYETTNVIEVIYGPTMAAAGALTASVGLNGSASFLSVTPAASSTASSSTANNSISSTTNLVGKKYIYTPPVVCSGTPNGGTVSPTSFVLNTGQLPGTIVGSGFTSGVTGLTFQWEESTDGFVTPVNAVGGSGATTVSYTPPAYNGTPKEYRLRVTCSGNSGYSTTCTIASCPAVAAFPWTENFDGLAVVGTTSFPGCWTKENGDWTTTNNASATQDANARSGTQFLRNTYSATNEYIWTQGFQLTAGTSYDFSFYWAGDTFSGWTGDVLYNTQPNSVGAIQLGSSFVTPATTTTFSYAKSLNTFVPSSSGVYYFAIRINATGVPWYLSFDDFRFEPSPACPEPLSLTANNFTANSADLNWTPGASEGLWNIQYGPTGFVLGTGTIISGEINPTYTAIGLSGNTVYQYYVQADCTGASGTSTWAGPFSFTTYCDAVIDFTQNFDAVTAPAFPSCWNKVGATGTANTQTANNSSAPNALFLNSSSAANKVVLRTTPVSNLGDGTHWLRFKMRASGTVGGIVEIGYVTDPADANSFVSLGSVTASTLTYQDYNFTPPAGSYSNYLALRHTGAPANGVLIDDVAWETAPSCYAPTALLAGNFTANSADLNWTPGGSEALWNVQYGVTGFVLGTGTIITGEINPTYTAAGLLANTTYQYYVQADCTGASGTSTWAGPFSFTTYCDAVIDFTQNFDAVTAPAFPSCWNKVGATGTANTQTANNSSAPNALFLNSSSAANKVVLRTTPVSNLGDGTHWLRFKMRASGTVGGIVEIGYVTDPADANSFVSLGSVTASTLTYQDYNFTPPAGSYSNYLALRHTGAPANGVLIDDVAWETAPSCYAPTALLAGNFTANSADLNWTHGGSEALWNVQYGVTGFVLGTGTIITGEINPTYTAAGLLANTTYQYYVQADCGAGDTSTWAGPISFTTACDATNVPYVQNFESVTTPAIPTCTSVVNDGTGNLWNTTSNPANGFTTKVLNYPYNSTNAANTWFFTQGINLTGGVSYRISYNYGNNSTFYTEKLKVAYGTSASGAGMTEVIADHPTINQQAIQSNVVDFTPVADGVYYIGFQAYSAANQFNLYVDNINVDLTPSCPNPTALLAGNFTANSADLNWTIGGSEALWNVQYGPTGFVLGTGTIITGETNPTYTAAGLLANTTYQYYVQADCGAGDTSTWAGPISFTTPCDATNVPYVQNFESVTTPAIPACTSVVNDGTGNLWNTTSNPGNGFTTKVLNYPYNSTNAANTWFFTQGINLTGGVSYRISYNYGNNSTFYTEKLKVAYGTSASGAGMTQVIADHPTINQQAIQSNVVDFTPVADGVYYIGFQAYSAANQFNLYVDNINIDLTPACPNPTGLAVSNLTDVGANVTWTATSGNYQYVLDNVATDPAGAGTTLAGEAYSAGPLSPTTLYYFHVRTDCGGLYSTWSTISFTTLVSPPVNNDLCNAVALTVGNVSAGNAYTNVGSTAQTNEPTPACFNSGINGSVWFSFVSPASGNVKVTTDISGGTLTDTEIAVYNATGVTCGDLTTLGTQLGCDQDGGVIVVNNSIIDLTGLTSGNTYYVQVDRWGTATNGTFGINVTDSGLSTPSFDATSFKAYPNPVKDILNLSYSKEISNVSVFNLLGQEVLAKTVNATQSQINLSSLSGGTYLVKVTVDGLVKTIKVVKE